MHGTDRKDDIVGKVLRERICYHLGTLDTEEFPCPELLEAYLSLMELREVADRCGYDDLVGLVDRYMDTGQGETV